jgi:di/tricarboxylate transporter
VRAALAFFLVALVLILFTDTRLSIALMAGAIGMILSGVLKIEEAYQAVSWKSVFLLASLIPLGLAVETSGTAAWIAQQTLSMLGGTPTWVLQFAIAVLATFFTLVMSNVGATVLLVPLAVNIAIGAGANPAVFALTVALATSNSFFLPTHQVNALIMGPAGYRVADFMRAGGIMTLLFLAVLMVMMNIVLMRLTAAASADFPIAGRPSPDRIRQVRSDMSRFLPIDVLLLAACAWLAIGFAGMFAPRNLRFHQQDPCFRSARWSA